jgi:hypothetical protein
MIDRAIRRCYIIWNRCWLEHDTYPPTPVVGQQEAELVPASVEKAPPEPGPGQPTFTNGFSQDGVTGTLRDTRVRL